MGYNIVESIENSKTKMYLVQCTRCSRYTIIKNKDRLQELECPTCNKFKVNDINADEKEIERIQQNTIADLGRYKKQTNYIIDTDAIHIPNIDISEINKCYVMNGIIGQFKTAKYSDSTVVEPTKVICRCIRCNKVKLLDMSDSENKVLFKFCNNCAYIYNDKENSKQLAIWQSCKDRFNTTGKTQGQKVAEFNNKVLKKQIENSLIDEQEIGLMKPNYSKQVLNGMERAKKDNPGLNVWGAYTSSGVSYTIVCSCKNCGNAISIPSTLKNKKMQCEGCEKQRTNPNYKGVYKRSITGTCRNGFIVVKDYGEKCDVQCYYCGKSADIFTVNKYDFLTNKLFCKKEHSIYEEYCQNCGAIISFSHKDVIDMSPGRQIYCSKCKEDTGICSEDIIADVTGTDSKISVVKNMKLTLSKLDKSVVTIEGVIRSVDALYISEDGEPYYNCRCPLHNSNMILTEAQINNFTHELCFDVRDRIIPITEDADVTEIKI